MASLILRTAKKRKIRKNKTKNRVAQKKRSRQKSVDAVREIEEVNLQRVGFVKEVGFKPGVKERWSYTLDGQSSESEEEEMMLVLRKENQNMT